MVAKEKEILVRTLLIHWFPDFQYILVSRSSLQIFPFQQTERINLFIYSEKNWTFGV